MAEPRELLEKVERLKLILVQRATGGKVDGAGSLYPNVADGVDGMNFITQCVASSKQNGAWLPLKHGACRA